MPTEIDSLQISIEAKATKANDAIDRLVGKLDRLSISMGRMNTSNLNGLANGVDRLGRAMQTMNTVKTADFTRLATNLAKLGNINVSALNSTASSLSHLTRAFNNVGAVSQNAMQVAELAKGISKLGNKSVTNAIANIPQLAVALRNLMATLSKAPTVSQNVIQMTNALANFNAQGHRVGSASTSVSKGLNRASTSAFRAKKSFGGLASAIGKFYATYFLLIRAVKGIGKAIDSTADYVESFNYFTVSMGKIASKWDEDWENYGDENARNYSNKFFTTLDDTFSKLSGISYDPQTGLLSETGLKNLGLNLQEVTQYAAQLSSMMDAVGQSGEVTLATTNAFVKLAGDISSLYNIDYQDAANKIRSVLQGQSRAGYGFGWDTTAAALQETAEKFGITKAVSEMAQWEKQQLRILTILEQSRVAYGDQSNTINTLANQIRLFKNNIKEAGMLLGQLFVPILTKLMPIINGVTIAIKRLLVSIASLLGISLDLSSFGQGYSGLEEGLDDVADGFDNATASAKKFKTYTLGIDELNIQPEQTDSSGGGAGVGGGDFIDLTDEILQATEEYERVWQEAFDNMENTAQAWADSIYRIFQPLEDMFANLSLGEFELAGEDFSDFFMQFLDIDWDSVYEVAKDWGKKLAEFLNGMISPEDFEKIGETIASSLNTALYFLNSFGATFKWGKFGQSMALSLKGFLETWDGDLTADTLSEFANGLLEAMTSALNELNDGDTFKDLGQEIVDFICGIQWSELIWNLGSFYEALEDSFTELPADFAVGIGEGIMQKILGDENFEAPPEIRDLAGDIIAVVNPMTGIFTKLEGTVSGLKFVFGEAVEFIKGKFQELPQPVQDVFNNIKETFAEAKENLKQTWGDAKEWFSEKIESVWGVFSGFALRVSQLFEGIWIILQAIFSPIVEWIQENFVEPIAEKFEEAKTNIQEVWGVVSKWFKENVIDKITSNFADAGNAISTTFSSLWEGIKSGAAAGMNIVISLIESGVNWIIDAINGMLEGFNEVAGKAAELIGEDYSGVSLLNNITLPRIEGYALGGFPNEYSLFMAGEGGHAEMLGTAGGRTAVAGGAEITGIRDAVYQSSQTEAELLREQNELLRQLLAKDTSVNIGDRDIYRASMRGSKSSGKLVIV